MITRLTIFLPSGKQLVLLIKRDYEYDCGVLTYTQENGIVCNTSLPFAIERDVPEDQKSPFQG
jgi:hypothetical protein